MLLRPPRSTLSSSSAASDVYKRQVMDQIISEAVKGISETITQPSLINLDYADVGTIMNSGGVAAMLVGKSRSKDKARDVVREAFNHPLLEVDFRGAKGALIHITGGPDLTPVSYTHLTL